MDRSKLYKVSFLFLSVLLILAYYCFAYKGFSSLVGVEYARISKMLLSGKVDYLNHIAYRWTVIFPTALSYLLLGVNYFSTSLPFIIYTILILVVVYFWVKHLSVLSVSIALMLTVLCNFIVSNSIRIGPDIPLAFFATLLFYILYLVRIKLKNHRTILFSLLYSATLMMVFISKGTVALILPYLFFLFIVDIVSKKYLRFWMYSTLFLIIFIIGYLCFDWLRTGDFFGRMDAIARTRYLNACSYGLQPVIIVIRRIIYQFYLLMINKEMAVGILFLIPFFIQFRRLRTSFFENTGSFIIVSVAVLWLSANFMSISLVHYNPMCLDARHYLYLIPLTAIAVSFKYEQFLESKRAILLFILSAFLFTVMTFFTAKLQAGFYILLTVYGVGLYFIKRKADKRIFSVLSLFLILMIPYFYRVYDAHRIDYKTEQQNITQFFKGLDKNSVIISDVIQNGINQFNLGFEYPDQINLVELRRLDSSVSCEGKDIYFIDNKRTQRLSRIAQFQLPLFFQYNNKYKHLMLTNNKGLSIYKMDTLILNPEIQPVFESVNYFDSDTIPNWYSNPGCFDSIIVYSKPFSEKVVDTSSCFYINLGNFQSCNNLLLKGQVELIQFDESSNFVEISVTGPRNEVKFKESIDVDRRLRAYGFGYTFSFQVLIKNEYLSSDNLLKVYFVNRDHNGMNIDDFDIKLYDLN